MTATLQAPNLSDSRYDTFKALLAQAKGAELAQPYTVQTMNSRAAAIAAAWDELYNLGEGNYWSEGEFYAALENLELVCSECDLLPAMPNSEVCVRCASIENPVEIPTKPEKEIITGFDRAIEKALVLQAVGKKPRVMGYTLTSGWVGSTTVPGRNYLVRLGENGELEGARCECQGSHYECCVHRAVLFFHSQDWLAQVVDEAGKSEAA